MYVLRNSAVFIVLATIYTLSGCTKVSSRSELNHISQLEKEVEQGRTSYGNKQDETYTAKLIELGDAYYEFAMKYEKAPESPEFLFRGGELYWNDLFDYQKAIKLFERNYQKYPDHATAPKSLFFIAYIYNNHLSDLIKAEKYYKEFLDKYPEHSMARDASFELENLGGSPDAVLDKILQSKSDTLPDTILVPISEL